jgi:hypothetical protein
MIFNHFIPIADIRVGDHFTALIPAESKRRGPIMIPRNCELMEICGQYLRVKTGTKREWIVIKRDQIVSQGWGEREDVSK